MGMQEVELGASLVATHAKKMPEDANLEALGHECFRLALDENNTWFTYDDDERFKIGLGALLVVLTDRKMDEDLRPFKLPTAVGLLLVVSIGCSEREAESDIRFLLPHERHCWAAEQDGARPFVAERWRTGSLADRGAMLADLVCSGILIDKTTTQVRETLVGKSIALL